MSVQLEIIPAEGNSVIIQLDERIKYTFQVNDIAEIADRQATYTSSFKVPRTSDITKVFEGLGIVGDTSLVPYQKVSCRLYENYVPVLEKGWLQIKTTDNLYYNIAVYSGVIDFFKAIEGFNLQDLSLPEIEHAKTIANITASWNAQPPLPYRYHITDYGGFNHYSASGFNTVVNIDYQIPSVQAKYFWDRIFETFGFTYSGSIFDSDDFTDLWLTIPKSPVIEDVDLTPAKYPFKQNYSEEGRWSPSEQIDGYEDWGATAVPGPDPGYITVNGDNWTMTINETGNYRFKINNLNGYIDYGFTGGDQDSFIFTFFHNGQGFYGIESKQGDFDDPVIFDIYLEQGETLNFQITRIPEYFNEWAWELVINEIDIQIFKIENTIIPQSDLIDFSIKDFFKEILSRYSLTAFPDKHSNNIHFMTPEERITSPDVEVEDWSDKYVRRVKEEYVYGYSRNNWLRYQYGEENEGGTYSDGNITVADENLKDEKTLLTSKTFSPSRQGLFFAIDDLHPDGISVRQYKKFDGSAEFDEDTSQLILDYETLEDRFYFQRGEIQQKNITLGSRNVLGDEQRVSDFYSAKFSGVDYGSVVNNYYGALKGIINEARIHTIELCLTSVDANQLDFKKLYWFDQEANYYILNKLTYEEGKISQAEFVRVKRTITLGEFSDDFSNDFNT